MPKSPLISGKRMVKALESIGYVVVRQKGSHMRLHHPERKKVTVPDYKRIGRGLMRKILRDAEVSPKEFEQLLKKK